MTAYHGGKQRIGKKLAQNIYEESLDIEDEYEFDIKGYCEPFCGMLGVYQHIPELFEEYKTNLKYKAGDFNKSVIKMWKAGQKGWIPPTRKVSRAAFMKMAGDGTSSPEKGYIGHLYGYMGKYFKPFDNRTTVSQRKRTSMKVCNIANKLQNVKFTPGSYTQFSLLRGYVLYCDPPYKIQSHYYDENNNRQNFDNSAFWNWCRKMAVDNIVFVSEYEAPKDFEMIWSQGKEKLFMIF